MPEALDLSKLQAYDLTGHHVEVVDGDTITVRRGTKSETIRLAGIDTPETPKPGQPGQAGAGLSTAYLQNVVTKYRSKLQLFIVPDQSTHGRLVGVLVVGDTNINLALVQRGLAGSYSPEGGLTGVSTGKFRAAERKAVQRRIGIFSDPEYRANYVLNRAGSEMSNVNISSPERLANNYAARVRVRALKGLRQADHYENVPLGIQGMNFDRPDFPGARSPGNIESMSLLDQTKMGLLRQAQAGWKSIVGSGQVSFLDVETAGLMSRDPVLNVGYLDIMSMKGGEYATHPAIWKGHGWEAAAKSAYDTPAELSAIRAMTKAGTRLSYQTPEGTPLTMEGVMRQMEESGAMPASMRRRITEHVRNLGEPRHLRSVMGEFLHASTQSDNAWLFIQNAPFESSRLAPGINDSLWNRMQQKGKLAFATSRKTLHSPFDQELFDISRAASKAQYAGDMPTAHKQWSKWLGRLRGMLSGDIEAPKGLKTVDIRDVAKGVFGTAATKGYFKGSTMGLLGQDVLGRLLGLPPELHTALDDAAMSSVITQKLLSLGDRLNKGQLTPDEAGFFKKAELSQPTMAIYNVYKDIANKLQGAGDVTGDYEISARMHGESTPIVLEGYKSVGGKAEPHKMQFEYTPTHPAPMKLRDYVARQLGYFGIDEDPDEVLNYSLRYRKLFSRMKDDSAVIDAITTEGSVLNTMTTRAGALKSLNVFLNFQRVEAAKAVRADESPNLDVTGNDFQSLKEKYKSIPGKIDKWWGKLPTAAKNKARVGGIISLALIGVSAIRESLDTERAAQPQSVDIEAYQARRHRQDAMQTLSGLPDRQMSHELTRMEKDPSRYYPTRM